MRPFLLLALPAAYVSVGLLGALVAVPPGYATPIFLPAGFAIAAVFVLGSVALPMTFLGSLLLNIAIGGIMAGKVGVTHYVAASIIAAGSMTQAAIAGGALRWMLDNREPFSECRDIFRFFVLAPFVCLISASLSLGGLYMAGLMDEHELTFNWGFWWMGDTLGLLCALPLIVWLTEPRWRLR